ncbi:hypothetical protein [Sorangium sp. So ce176]|uniref:hypothetical protein n=1 Tax=Sorangium sp. So ce176 TaxID=3133286 RepID=UPI003F604570
MSKNHGAAARRAKRKHEKEQKRKKRPPHRPLGVSARPAVPASAPEIRWQPEIQGIEGLAALAQVPFYEAACMADCLARSHARASRPLADAVWTRDRVCALETSALAARLEQLGIRVDHGAFIAETPRFGSAVRWARETWLPFAPAHADVHARDFITLAACELWKRWRPEPPSQESLHELLVLGEDHADREDDIAATEHWIRFWRALQPLLTPELRTTSAAGELLEVDASVLFNWASDFSMVATYVAGQDAAVGLRAAEVQGEILAQFSAEQESWRLPLVCDRAEVLYVAGERIEAERILREQIEAHPTSAGAYVRLAELWAPYGIDDREAITRALALLVQAAARPVEDAASWDLDVRIKALRKQLQACGGDGRKAATA